MPRPRKTFHIHLPAARGEKPAFLLGQMDQRTVADICNDYLIHCRENKIIPCFERPDTPISREEFHSLAEGQSVPGPRLTGYLTAQIPETVVTSLILWHRAEQARSQQRADRILEISAEAFAQARQQWIQEHLTQTAADPVCPSRPSPFPEQLQDYLGKKLRERGLPEEPEAVIGELARTLALPTGALLGQEPLPPDVDCCNTAERLAAALTEGVGEQSPEVNELWFRRALTHFKALPQAHPGPGLGTLVRGLRQMEGFRQWELDQRAGVPVGWTSRLELGSVPRNPKPLARLFPSAQVGDILRRLWEEATSRQREHILGQSSQSNFARWSGRPHPEPESLGALLKAARLATNLTQGQLAERLGTFQHQISAWETNRSCPSQTELESLATVLPLPLEPAEALRRAGENSGREMDR